MVKQIGALVPPASLSLVVRDAAVFGGVLVIGALMVSSAVSLRLSPLMSAEADFPFLLAFAASLIAVNAVFGLYRDDRAASQEKILRALGSTMANALIVYVAIKAMPSTTGRPPIDLQLAMYALCVAAVRPAMYTLGSTGFGVRRVLIVGVNADAAKIVDRLQERHAGQIEVVGMFEAGPSDPAVAARLRIFGPGADLWQVVSDWHVDEVIVAVREQRGGSLPLVDLLECRIRGVKVFDQTAFFERSCGEFPIESLKASWLIYGRGFEQSVARTLAKRCLDIAGSVFLLAVSLPLMIVAAIAIKLESPGAVIYRQQRVGQFGRLFWVLKFRSMRDDAERNGVAQWAVERDPRITRVGRMIRKMRIDELPQLLNVLHGEMSLVGPRPERPSFVGELSEQIRFYDLRHSIKPGLTGWAQVRFSYAASIDDSRRKLQYDLYYVKNHSLLLDLRILGETARVVLLGRGAH